MAFLHQIGRTSVRTRLLFLTALLLSGCFWESSPPDFQVNDFPLRLTVIWDQPVTEQELKRLYWLTEDKSRLKRLMQGLDSASWRSTSVLPTCHPTRFILEMHSGKVWELCRGFAQSGVFGVFDRKDRGWAGQIDRPDDFLQQLMSMMASDTGLSIDLFAEYLGAIREGSKRRTVPPATRKILSRYPGYPELVWNKDLGRFEYSTE